MRIIYIITRADEIGGAQVHVRDVATALNSSGHEIIVLAGPSGSLSDQLAARGVPFQAVPPLVRPIAPWRDALAVRQLSSILRRVRPDLVSVHSSKAGWLGRLAAKLAGIPVILTAHGWKFAEGLPPAERRLSTVLERLFARLADHIITVCEHDRRLALACRIAPPSKITCIHNGVHDIAAGAPVTRLADTTAGAPVRIVMIGRFSPQKDHAGLLHALAPLGNLHWRLWLIGGGPDQAAAIALARDLRLGDRVQFLGERDDARAFLERADIFALASHWEGLPYSVLEAMSAGLPVIASAVGGVPEAVIDGETGILVPREDTAALRNALASLISDPERRHRLGTAARQRYESAFRFERMLSDTLAIYERVAVTARGTAARARQRS
jgi:glycosyltransferase involved in cell wall biosynthesis